MTQNDPLKVKHSHTSKAKKDLNRFFKITCFKILKTQVKSKMLVYVLAFTFSETSNSVCDVAWGFAFWKNLREVQITHKHPINQMYSEYINSSLTQQ